MIGRLVQDQELRRRFRTQHAGQGRPEPLAAAEGGGLLLGGGVAEQETGQRRMGVIDAGTRVQATEVLQDCLAIVQQRSPLVEHGRRNPTPHSARRRQQRARRQPDKRGFACAI